MNKVFISLKMSQIQKEIDQLEQLISNTAFISESDEDSFDPPSLSDEDPDEEPILFSLEDEISQEVLELEREEVEVGTEAESRDKVETNQLIVLGLNRGQSVSELARQHGLPWHRVARAKRALASGRSIGRPGRPKSLTPTQEEELCEHLLHSAVKRKALDRFELQKEVSVQKMVTTKLKFKQVEKEVWNCGFSLVG